MLGAKEMETRTVSVRARDSKGELVTLPLEEAMQKLSLLRESRTLENSLS